MTKKTFLVILTNIVGLRVTSNCSESVVLNVLFNVGKSLGVFSVVQDSDGRSTSSLSGDTFFIVFALSKPFSEILSFGDGDEWDFVLLGKGGDKFLVLWVFAVLGEDAKVSILSIQSLTDLVEALNAS